MGWSYSESFHVVLIVMKTLPTASTSEQLPQLELGHLTLHKASEKLKSRMGGKGQRQNFNFAKREVYM